MVDHSKNKIVVQFAQKKEKNALLHCFLKEGEGWIVTVVDRKTRC